jgi:hypothetical protein
MGYGQPPDKGQLSSYLASSQKHCPQVDRSNRRSRVVKTGFDGWDSRQSFSQLPPVRCAPRMDGDFLRTLNAKNGRRSWVIATAKAMKGPKRGGWNETPPGHKFRSTFRATYFNEGNLLRSFYRS